MTTLLDQIAGFKSCSILVVGDFMLDEFVYGDAERLSPDAPVPVLRSERTERSSGGSANVATCLQGFGATVACCGVVGSDDEGSWLIESLSKAGAQVDGLIIDETRPTTVKKSLVGLAQHRHPQKMFRIDVESSKPLDASIHDRLLDVVRERIAAGVDVVCLEDYGKGVCSTALCQSVIELASAADVPVLVDPARIGDWGRYKGATAMTPNRTELEEALGRTLGEGVPDGTAATEVMDGLALDALVMTLDRHGALLVRPGVDALHVPTTARSVYDVTGAGDMVLAALAVAIGNGLGWPAAVEFANAAA
ncbi:MAG: PfkB family carbohydrate kinase, partial [Phycisphaerales bacterium]|nr:PfkB family carbohydrate kinase [Phycisphaerales bacterium]